MVRKTESTVCWLCERGNDDCISYLQRSQHGHLSEFGQIILVRPANFLDQTVCSQSFQLTGDLRRRLVRQHLPQRPVRQPTEVVFAASDGNEQFVIFRCHHIEATVAAAPLARGAGDLPGVIKVQVIKVSGTF